MTRKQELRAIMLDIIAGRESVRYTPNQQAHLFIGTAEVLLRSGYAPDDLPRTFTTRTDPELGQADKLLAMEIFWDLIIDKVITPGMDMSNPLPFFRVHSEAEI